MTSFKRSTHTLTLSAPNPATGHLNPRLPRKLLGTHRQLKISLLWGHCLFLLGPGAHEVLFVPSQSLFPQSCVSSGSSMVGLMTTSKRADAIPRSIAPGAPAPVAGHCGPGPSGDTHMQFWLGFCRVSVSWCTQGLFEAPGCLWRGYVFVKTYTFISPR